MKYKLTPCAFDGYTTDDMGILVCHLLQMSAPSPEDYGDLFEKFKVLTDDHRIYPEYVIGFDEWNTEDNRLFPETWDISMYFFKINHEYKDRWGYSRKLEVIAIPKIFVEEITDVAI